MRPAADPRLYGTVSLVLACRTALLRPVEPTATNAPANQVLTRNETSAFGEAGLGSPVSQSFSCSQSNS